MATDSKSKDKNLAILEKIIETASNHFDLKEILNEIVLIIGKITKADSCFIYLISGNEVILKASLNPHQSSLSKIKMKVGEGITGWVAETKKTVAIPAKAYQDKRFKLFTNLPEDRFEGFLSVPIIFRNKVIGVINVQHKKVKRYSKSDVDFLETIGKQIGGILEVSRLISETNVLKEALETQKLVNKAKAILMKNNNLSEDQAHNLLVKKSMDKRRSIKEVAEAIILAQEVIK
ncbi:MAG: ANTAR domain-containing protein [Patescibacteria group bacterium]|jgi:uroporphyrinogen-III synthase|nr:ANTAR domain-containing protein [Patescibacteria group bacterium]